MKPAPFTYRRAQGLTEALQILAEQGDQAKVIAGGVSLAPVLNMRLARPAMLLDIGRLPLAGIRREGDRLRIGALTRHADVVSDPLVRQLAPLLAEAGAQIGHEPIRNRGTIGGSLAHADPAAEWPVAVCALGATVTAASLRGERGICMAEFNLGYFTTALEPDEIITEVTVPVSPQGMGWSFLEYSRRVGDFAIVSVACGLRLQNGEVTDARLVLGGVSDKPERLSEAESALIGGPAGDGALEQVARAVGDLIDPPEDLHATAAYRRHLARGLALRALKAARSRGGV